MKALLFVFLLVAFVCKDPGYTKTCFTGIRSSSMTCPPGQELCYTKTWCNERCYDRGQQVEMGCTTICPTWNPREDFTCCSTDNCNPIPEKPIV